MSELTDTLHQPIHDWLLRPREQQDEMAANILGKLLHQQPLYSAAYYAVLHARTELAARVALRALQADHVGAA